MEVEELNLSCIGDSLTYGFGVRGNESWVSLLKNKLEAQILNVGINGDTTDGMLYRFERDLVRHKPSRVIIMGGTNDLIMGGNITSIIKNIDSLVKKSFNNNIIPIIGIQPKTDPYMANLYWSEYTDFKEVNEELRKYREWVLGYCNNMKIAYIDFYKEIEDNLNKYNKEDIFIDGVHFTPLGHEIMASIVEI